MKHYYSEPYKEKSLWYVDKINSETNKTIHRQQFASENLANEFLTTKNVYMDGELIHTSYNTKLS